MNPFSKLGSGTKSVSTVVALLLASFASNLVAQSLCAPSPAGLVSWWQAESNALDSVGGNNGQLQTGASFAAGKVGTAFSFDGLNSKVDLGDPASLAFTNSFSIEGWIWVNSAPTVSQGHGQILYRGDPRFCLDPYFLSVEVSGSLKFHIEDAQDTVPCGVDLQAGPLPLHQWKHVSAVFDGASGAMQIYVDGVLSAQTNTAVRPFAALINGGTAIGNLSVGQNGQSFDGLIDELAVYNRALTAAEIDAIYSSGAAGKCAGPTPPFIFTQPTSQNASVGQSVSFSVVAGGSAPLTYQWEKNGAAISGATGSALVLNNVQLEDSGLYSVVVSNGVSSVTSSNASLSLGSGCVAPPAGLVSWWRGEGNYKDSFGTNDGAPVNGVGFVAGEVGQAFNITSISSGVGLGNPPELQIQNFSLEVWLKRASATRSSWDVYGFAHVLGAAWGGYGIGLNDKGNIFLSKIGYSAVYSTNTVSDTNAFHHIAVTKSGGSVTFYIDGVAEAAAVPYDPGFVFNGPFAIGARGSDYVAAFFGAIDEPSIYNRALTASEVAALFQAGSGGKCVGLTCQPPPSGLVSWWKGEGNPFDSAGTNEGILKNGVSFVTGEVGQAFQFNGTNQYLEIPDSPSLDPTNSLTLETWVYVSGYPNTDLATIITKFSPTVPQQNQYQLETHNIGSNLVFRPVLLLPSGYGLVEGSTTIQFNTWYHVAMTYDGSMLKLYVNGALDGSVAATGSIAPTIQPLRIGGPSSGPWWFKGRVDEVSLYNRALSASEVLAIYQAGQAGKCLSPMAPVIVIQPTNQTALLGANVSFSVTATGTAPLSYRWSFGGVPISGATSSALALPSVSFSNAGSYSVVVTNVVGAITSSPAALTVVLPAGSVDVAGSLVGLDGTVTVPLNLVANGNENALSFTLDFDPTILTISGVSLGSGASRASLLVNSGQALAGRVGVAIALPTGQTFSAGTQQVAVATFSSPLIKTATSTSVSFGNSPVTNLVVDVSGKPLAATFVPGTVLLPPSQLEGDVYPRPNGDQALTVSDWVLVGRYVAGLDAPTNALEFQKADCAPRATLGDGKLTVSDWVQAGRYAAGLDPATRAGGPTGGLAAVVSKTAPSGIAPRTQSTLRQVRVSSPVLAQGQAGGVQVVLEAQGNENGLGFSLSFDPAQLVFVGATAGTAANGAVLNVNANQATQGRLGCVLALKANESFAAGSKQMVNVMFRPTAAAGGTSPVSFGDQPVVREVSDPNASTLAADYINGAVIVAPLPSLNITTSSKSITLSWPATASGFVLQESSDANLRAASWTTVTATPSVVNNQSVVSVPLATAKKFYRLYRP